MLMMGVGGLQDIKIIYFATRHVIINPILKSLQISHPVAL